MGASTPGAYLQGQAAAAAQQQQEQQQQQGQSILFWGKSQSTAAHRKTATATHHAAALAATNTAAAAAPAGVIGWGGQPALHRLAERNVFPLHPVAGRQAGGHKGGISRQGRFQEIVKQHLRAAVVCGGRRMCDGVSAAGRENQQAC